MEQLLDKDPINRVTIAEMRRDPWLTEDRLSPLLSEQENCTSLVEVTEDEIAAALSTVHEVESSSQKKSAIHARSSTDPGPGQSSQASLKDEWLAPATTASTLGAPGLVHPLSQSTNAGTPTAAAAATNGVGRPLPGRTETFLGQHGPQQVTRVPVTAYGGAKDVTRAAVHPLHGQALHDQRQRRSGVRASPIAKKFSPWKSGQRLGSTSRPGSASLQKRLKLQVTPPERILFGACGLGIFFKKSKKNVWEESAEPILLRRSFWD